MTNKLELFDQKQNFGSAGVRTQVKRNIIQALCIGAIVSVATFIFHPEIGITDIDATSYLIGAQSLRKNNQYTNLEGQPLNHWPIGYSYLLSLSSNPVILSKIINYLSLGLLTTVIFLSLATIDYPITTSSSISLILGFGFFRYYAVLAKPDIFCYALFLSATFAYFNGDRCFKILSILVFAALIPIKLIALTFIPALILAEMVDARNARFLKSLIGIVGILSWLSCLLFVAIYNLKTSGAIIPSSHSSPELPSIGRALWQFLYSFPREIFACWYGTIKPTLILVPFLIVSVVGSLCYATLLFTCRKELTAKFLFGIIVLALSFCLQFKNTFDFSARLSGYGPLICLCALRNPKHLTWAWLAYGALFLALVTVNMSISECRGVNHPAYRKSALEAQEVLKAVKFSSADAHDSVVTTNSFYILDINDYIASRKVTHSELTQLPPGSVFWRVTLPNYDSIASTIDESIIPPEEEWEVLRIFPNSIIYRKMTKKHVD